MKKMHEAKLNRLQNYIYALQAQGLSYDKAFIRALSVIDNYDSEEVDYAYVYLQMSDAARRVARILTGYIVDGMQKGLIKKARWTTEDVARYLFTVSAANGQAIFVNACEDAGVEITDVLGEMETICAIVSANIQRVLCRA